MGSPQRVKPSGVGNAKNRLPGHREGRQRLAAGEGIRLAVQPGGNALLAEETLDEEKGLGRQRPHAPGTREGKFALMRYFLKVHASGLGVIEREGKPAFPIIHPVVRTMLLLGVGYRLGETPNFPLQILGHAGGMESDVMLSYPGDHGFGANDS